MLQTSTRRLRAVCRSGAAAWLVSPVPTSFASARLTRNIADSAAMSLASNSTAAADPARFAFHVAAAYSPKGKPFNPATDAYTPSAAVWPDLKTPRSKAGQDAFFVAARSSGDVAIGVVRAPPPPAAAAPR